MIIGRADDGLSLPELPGVTLTVLDRPKVRAMFLPIWKHLQRAKPQIVFSAEDHLNIMVLLAAIASGSKTKISGSSRVTPFDTYSDKILTKRWFLKQLAKAVMWRADALTCVSQGTVDEYRKVFRNPPHVCVYNIVDDASSRQRMQEPIEHKWFGHPTVPVLVAAGTLEPWKGYENLIRAMKVLSERRSAKIIILGDGRLRTELESLVLKLCLTDVVCLPGYVQNPLKYFVHAKVFAHSALVESLGNVLVEAMMCGCTPVSTDCPTGPREVLQDGRYGYLVPMRDPVAMAAGIERALDNPIPKCLLAEAVRPFEEQAVLQRHFEVLGLEWPDGQ